MSRPDRASPSWKGPPGTHWIGGWVGLSAGLDTEAGGKIVLPQPGIEPRSPASPVRNQTLYLVAYPGYRFTNFYRIKKATSRHLFDVRFL
jgi:hypothetical protein